MINAGDFYNGLNIVLDGEIWTVVWFQHHKPGKGGAILRAKLKRLSTGNVIERTFRPEEKIQEAILQKVPKQYLYNDGENFYFMDLNDFEQISLPGSFFADKTGFLKENLEVIFIYHNQEIVDIELPTNVELKVIYTEQGVKGDRVSRAMKPATLETNLEVMVPLFINTGDIVKIDTRTGEYVERIS